MMEGFIGFALGLVLSFPLVKAVVSRYAVGLEELGDLLVVVAEAVKDGKITAEEIKRIKEEGEDVIKFIESIRGDK